MVLSLFVIRFVRTTDRRQVLSGKLHSFLVVSLCDSVSWSASAFFWRRKALTAIVHFDATVFYSA